MPALFRAARAVAAPILVAWMSTAALAADRLPDGLLEMLERWLDANADLPRREASPVVSFASLAQLQDPEALATVIGRLPRGLYDGGTITLVRPWAATEPQDVAVLVHELYHHRQAQKHFYCQAAQEMDAYRVQRRWLEERGLTLDVYWPAVVLASSCAPRDVHPD